jgi:shikimate kinase
MIRVILIGYMGAGKTTVGKELAKSLGISFYDLDWYIESRMRKSVKQIFDEGGEEKFRRIEYNMLHEVAEFENVIISCGGGTPCFFDNMEYLNRQGETIYLQAEPNVLMQHLKMGKGVRPLLLDKTENEKEEYITDQLKEREQYYLKAKHVMDVNLMDSYAKIEEHIERIRQMLNL